MIIDMHTHYVPADLADAFRGRKVPPYIETKEDGFEIFHMPHGPLAFPPSFVDMEARLGYMEEQGVARQVVSFPGLFGLDSIAADESLPLVKMFNDATAQLTESHSGAFSGMAALPFADMNLAVKEYKRARNELGLMGAILPVNGFVSLADAEKLRPIFEIAQDIGGHLFIHPGRRPDEVPETYDPNRRTPFSDSVPERMALVVQDRVAHCTVTLLFSDFLDPYPDVTLQVANLGGTLPMVIERMDQTAFTRGFDRPYPSEKSQRVHVDCSSLGPRALETAVALFGADRVVFGTDCPIFLTDWSKKAIDDARLSDVDREAILFGNAEELLERHT